MSEAAESPTPFIKRPIKPWQRIAASLFASGMPVNDITVEVDQPIAEISRFLTSPDGRDLLRDRLRENKDKINELLDAAAVDSLLTLIHIRDTEKTPAARISACKEILSKTLPGVKARERRRSDDNNTHQDPEEEIASLRDSVNKF